MMREPLALPRKKELRHSGQGERIDDARQQSEHDVNAERLENDFHWSMEAMTIAGFR